VAVGAPGQSGINLSLVSIGLYPNIPHVLGSCGVVFIIIDLYLGNFRVHFFVIAGMIGMYEIECSLCAFFAFTLLKKNISHL